MQYCCGNFKESVEMVGSKGLSIIPEHIEEFNLNFFVIQYRNYDIGHEIEVKTLSIGNQAIHFCPWCGSNLSKLISDNLKEFIELAEKNKIFLNFI